MNISVVCIGKIKEKFFRDALDEYSKRLSRFAKFEIIEVRDERIPDNPSEKEISAILEKEGAAVMAKIPKNSRIIAMCIEGKELSSTALAEKMREISMTSSHITFIIGGSLGLSDNVKSMADIKLSFGKITLPHQLMRVILLEQIYRAFRIMNGEPYHK